MYTKTFIATPEKVIIPQYRLGRNQLVLDSRNLMLARYLNYKVLPPLPNEFNLLKTYGVKDNFVFANDKYGDCVIAGRAHQTLAFEKFEQGLQIPISDTDVTSEYFKETGGPDSGLDILTSLNDWRNNGWMAGGKFYTIDSFAELSLSNHNEVLYTVFMLRGAYTGVQLPISAQTQTGPGKVWDVDNTPNGVPDSWGGHCIFVVGWNTTGPICITWGFEQQMTWPFWNKHVDQSFVVIDAFDSWMNPANDPLNIDLLKKELAEIEGVNPVPNPTPPVPPKPPQNCCKIGTSVIRALRRAHVNFERK